jgi:hypothetical protein
MNERLAATATDLLAARDGVVTARLLRDQGLSTAQVASLVRRGTLLRLRRDVLVDRARWEASPHWARHAVRARGVMASLDPHGTKPLALSHHSALALHGVDLYGVDDAAHLVRVGAGRGHRSRGLQIHAPVEQEHVTDAFGLKVVCVPAAVLQVAAQSGVPSGLVAADSAIRAGLCTRADLTGLLDWSALRKDRPAARVVAARASGLHESAGESRCAWLLHVLGLPQARPQVTLRTRAGDFVARVDLYIAEHRLVVEFDGMGKYTDPAVVRREKLREDRLRALGVQVVRLTWADLDQPEVVRRKVQSAIARNRATVS